MELDIGGLPDEDEDENEDEDEKASNVQNGNPSENCNVPVGSFLRGFKL